MRTLRPVPLKGGGVTLVPSMEYQHPAVREAQAAVRDRAAMQGPGGRARASSRHAICRFEIGFDYCTTFAPEGP